MTPVGTKIRGRAKFAQIPAWILTHPDLNPQAVVVWGVLYTSSWEAGETDIVDISHASIAEKLGVSTSSVGRAVRLLKEVGAIATDPNFGSHGQGVNTYVLATPEGVVKNEGGCKNDYPQGSAKMTTPSTIIGNSEDLADESADPEVNPHDKDAQRLTVLAFEQTPSPATKFVAVRSNILRLLEAGHPANLVAAAIEQHLFAAWTISSMEFGLSKVDRSRMQWTPEGDLLAIAEHYDRFFEDGLPPEDAPWLTDAVRPSHPEGNLTTADGRRYTVTADGARRWIDP